jgi:hypothetical protein
MAGFDALVTEQPAFTPFGPGEIFEKSLDRFSSSNGFTKQIQTSKWATLRSIFLYIFGHFHNYLDQMF